MAARKESLPPGEGFEFTEREELFGRVRDERFAKILADSRTTVHEITEDSNNYGEFLFVTVSRPDGNRRACLTFYGLGYHEYRERWIIDEWAWYEANATAERLGQEIPKHQAEAMIRERRESITPYVGQEEQSPRAKLFELLADLTDEDGAYVELEDLGDVADWLLGDPE